MVRGIDTFRTHFERFRDRYILIGGTACDVAMEIAGASFRATKDLDIVLCVEALDTSFIKSFWEFVGLGGYRHLQKSTGRKLFYRFHDPEDLAFPHMLELFARVPDALVFTGHGHLTPIPVEGEAKSLSAILLDEVYYRFIIGGKYENEGLSLLAPTHLIPLKAIAWLDLTARRDRGECVDNRDIRKHRNDVLRLFRIVDPDMQVAVPETIRRDLGRFVEQVAKEPVDMTALGFGDVGLIDFLMEIRIFYGIV